MRMKSKGNKQCRILHLACFPTLGVFTSDVVSLDLGARPQQLDICCPKKRMKTIVTHHNMACLDFNLMSEIDKAEYLPYTHRGWGAKGGGAEAYGGGGEL